MTTTVTNTIQASGGDYATVALWEDGTDNTSLVAADEIREGQCANETFTVAGGVVTIAGATTDATRYRHLTTQSGASFRDNANVQTNALRYNTANGAALASSSNYTYTIRSTEQYSRISKLQITNTGPSYYSVSMEATGQYVDYCVIEGKSSAAGQAYRSLGSSSFTRNTLIVNRTATPGTNKAAFFSRGTVVNVTVVATGSAATGSFLGGDAYLTAFKNCAFFGAASASGLISGGASHTYTTCYTDKSSPPSGCTVATYDTSTGSGFQNITDGTHDYRLKSTSAMLDVGTTDSTNAGNDIAGTGRPSGSAYDVGCWEYVAAAAGIVAALLMAGTAVNRAATY